MKALFVGDVCPKAENVKALETLVAQDGINFDPAIVGGDEMAAGKVMLKNMLSGEQQLVTLEELVQLV